MKGTYARRLFTPRTGRHHLGSSEHDRFHSSNQRRFLSEHHLCAAVDGSGYATTYNGTSWSTPSNIDGTHALDAVSCTSSTFCKAVDNAGNALTYNGSSWSSATSIDSTRTINGISCSTTTFCAAVDASGYGVIFNGTTWTASHIDGNKAINSVSCATSSTCKAVDSSGNVLTYSSGSWSGTTSIDTTRAIKSVSCPSSTFCAAVDGSGYATTYNGTSWSTPTNIDGTHAIDSVSCASTTFCKTVDNTGNALTYNGSTWSSATPIDSTRIINGISCPTTTFCAAVDGSGYGIIFQPVTTLMAQLTWNNSGSLPLVISDGTNHYIYGPTATPVEQVSLATSTPSYLTYTPANSSWIATNSTGDQTGSWAYDAYGTLAFGTPTSPFGYAGQYLDATTGLSNMRARWYQPQTGGFTGRDRMFSRTDMAYAYAGGDPVNRTDPTGESFETGLTTGVCGDVAAYIGAGIGIGGEGQPCALFSYPSDQDGLSFTVGIAGLNVGIGASASTYYLVSNAETVHDMSGPFEAVSVNLGAFGIDISGEFFWSINNGFGGVIGFAGGPGLIWPPFTADVGLWLQNTWTYTLPSSRTIGSTIGGILGGIGGWIVGGWLGGHVDPVKSLVQSLGWGKQKSEQVLQAAEEAAAAKSSGPASLLPCTTLNGPGSLVV